MKIFLALLVFISSLYAEELRRGLLNPDISLIGDISLVKGERDLRERFNTDAGFNLNYLELFLGSAVDPYFDFSVFLHFLEEGVEVDEAYAKTRGLPFGFNVKAGKFRASFGRHNTLHAHNWKFPDPPLPFRKVFGEEGLLEKGISLSWVAPTEVFISFTGEVLQGEGNNPPSSFILRGELSTDIGNLTLLAGSSYSYEHKAVGADLTVKYFLSSYKTVELEGEILSSRGERGFYIQTSVPITRRWRISARYGTFGGDGRVSGAIELRPTEFSLLRLTYNHGEIGGRRVREVILQAGFAIGAHRAHPF